jgi:hypothetical protein
MNDKLTEEQVYALAKRRVEARRDFVIHLIVYLGVNTLLVCLWLFVTGRGFPWFVFPLGGWGIGLIAHFFSTRVHREADKIRSASVEREADRIRSEGP